MTGFVDLECAYAWTCPACQVRQFVEAVPIELNSAEAVEASRETGIPVEMVHHAVTGEPEDVECVSCGCSYLTERNQ